MCDGCLPVGGSPYAALREPYRLGVPERGFEGDHDDIPEQLRAAAVREGAIEVSSRTLVEALYEAGLRQRPSTRN